MAKTVKVKHTYNGKIRHVHKGNVKHIHYSAAAAGLGGFGSLLGGLGGLVALAIMAVVSLIAKILPYAIAIGLISIIVYCIKKIKEEKEGKSNSHAFAKQTSQRDAPASDNMGSGQNWASDGIQHDQPGRSHSTSEDVDVYEMIRQKQREYRATRESGSGIAVEHLNSSNMKYCRHCGVRILSDSCFCPSCGGRQS